MACVSVQCGLGIPGVNATLTYQRAMGGLAGRTVVALYVCCLVLLYGNTTLERDEGRKGGRKGGREGGRERGGRGEEQEKRTESFDRKS